MSVSTDSSPTQVALSTPKTHSRPALLTLQGLYSTTKTVYSTYCPAMASDLLETAMTKVLTVGVPAVEPYILKVLPASEGEKKEKAPVELPTDLARVDALLAAAFNSGDAKIDEYVEYAHTKANETKASVAARVDSVKAKAASTKTWAHEKYEDATLSNAKALVARKLSEEPFSSAASAASPYLERVKPYYNAVASNVEPARALLGEFVGYAQHDLATKGVVQVAKESAEVLKLTGYDAYEVCKTKGPVTGVKELSSSALAAAASKLEAAKASSSSSDETAIVKAEEPSPAAAPEVAPSAEPTEPKKEEFMDVQEE